MTPDVTPSQAERIGIALFLGAAGFITGLIAVWVLDDLPGLHLGRNVYLSVAAVCGIVCLVGGYRSSERTTDELGGIWGVLWKLSLGVIGIVRSLIR